MPRHQKKNRRDRKCQNMSCGVFDWEPLGGRGRGWMDWIEEETAGRGLSEGDWEDPFRLRS